MPSFVHGDPPLVRRYLLHAVPGWQVGGPFPLRVLLHGGGSFAEEPANALDFSASLPIATAYALDPAQPRGVTLVLEAVTSSPLAWRDRKKDVVEQNGCWNTGLHGTECAALGVDDVSCVFSSIVDGVSRLLVMVGLPPDRWMDLLTRVDLVAYGAGGTLAWRLLGDLRRTTALPGLTLFQRTVIIGATHGGYRYAIQRDFGASEVSFVPDVAVSEGDEHVLLWAFTDDRVPWDGVEAVAMAGDVADLALFGQEGAYPGPIAPLVEGVFFVEPAPEMAPLRAPILAGARAYAAVLGLGEAPPDPEWAGPATVVESLERYRWTGAGGAIVAVHNVVATAHALPSDTSAPDGAPKPFALALLQYLDDPIPWAS